jgi:hypothetical protein
VRQSELARHLVNRERLPLDDVEPARARLEPLSPAAARARLEADDDPDAGRRDVEREEARRRLAVASAQAT